MKTEFDKSCQREIHMTRSFDASRERVWAMWTQSEHLQQWWGPEGWTFALAGFGFIAWRDLTI